MVESPVPTPGASLGRHSDAQLADLLGSPVVGRRTVHEWPLTRTELVALADGKRYAYKVQLPPSIEPDFYATVAASFLASHTDLGAIGGARALAIDWVDGDSLGASRPDDTALARIAGEVARAVHATSGAPWVLDLGSPAAFATAIESIADSLDALLRAGHFVKLTHDDVEWMRAWSRRPDVLTATAAPAGLVHGDLTLDEVFIAPGGYRVIDWQRPVRGPWVIDAAALLRSGGVDAEPHLGAPAVQLSWIPLVHWAVVVATEVFPTRPHAIPEAWVVQALAEMRGLDRGSVTRG